jgi:ABC-type uncharacterized transport system ATPase subunit
VLLSTHILSEAQQICDRVLIINKTLSRRRYQKAQARLMGGADLWSAMMTDSISIEKIPGIRYLPSDGVYEVSMVAGRICPEIARMVINSSFDLSKFA